MKLRIYFAVLLAVVPSMAFAKPKTTTAHMRPQLFRDRSPQARVRDSRPRETRVRPKSPPPPAVKEDF
jgi:hypothetical protein